MIARFLLTAAFLVFACFQIKAQPAPLFPAAADGNGLEQESFFLVNQYRNENKLPPFQWSDAIAKVARGHSKDMASGDVDFGHDGFGERVTHLKTVMIGLTGAGENVLKTDDPDQIARRAVDLWLKSPHHLKNIRGDFNYSGMGIWKSEDGFIYFTQIFVKTEPEAQAAKATPMPGIMTPFGLLAAPKTR